MSDLTTIVAEYEAISETFRQTIQDKLKVAFTEFFTDNPEFRSIEWVQYTPYFNDGDPCEFRVGDFWYTLQPELYPNAHDADMVRDNAYSPRELEEHDVLWVPDESDRNRSWMKALFDEWDALPADQKAERIRLNGIWTKMREALEGIPVDIFETTFEDHSQIQVTRDGIDITEYSHD